MKKLLLLLTVPLLLTVNLLAKEALPQKKYHVEIVQENSNKKGFKSSVYIKIQNFFFAVSEKVSIDIVAKKIEVYVNTHGLSPLALSNHFKKSIKISLIKDFHSSKWSYAQLEPIGVNYGLRQKAYTYLLSVEKDEMCLIFPNTQNNQNLQNESSYSLNGFAFDQRGELELYMIGSLNTIDFSSFRPNSIYRCISRHRGENKLTQIRNNNTNDVKRYDISIK